MITSRHLRFEEREPTPLMPERPTQQAEAKPPKYAKIERISLGRVSDRGDTATKYVAYDMETGEIIASETVTDFGYRSAAKHIKTQAKVEEAARDAGYKINKGEVRA